MCNSHCNLIAIHSGLWWYLIVITATKPLGAPAQVLVKEGIICICAGGGGIPVALEQEEGGTQWRRHGVEAVIDKVVQETQLLHN